MGKKMAVFLIIDYNKSIMSSADYTSGISLCILVIILAIVIIIIVMASIAVQEIYNELSKLEQLVVTALFSHNMIMPSQPFPTINYNSKYYPVFPSINFNKDLAQFLCNILMSSINQILNRTSFFPNYIYIKSELRYKDNVIGYILEVSDQSLYIISLTGSLGNKIYEISGIQTGFSDLYDNNYPKAEVSISFNQVYNAIKKSITNLIEQYMPNLIITGYSAGAGIATLLSTGISCSFPSLSVCYYGFGSPKVGNNTFYNLMADKLANRWDILNSTDIVPQYPLSSQSLSPYHFSNTNHIFTINTGTTTLSGNHNLSAYLCGLDTTQCQNSTITWNTTIYSANPSS